MGWGADLVFPGNKWRSKTKFALSLSTFNVPQRHIEHSWTTCFVCFFMKSDPKPTYSLYTIWQTMMRWFKRNAHTHAHTQAPINCALWNGRKGITCFCPMNNLRAQSSQVKQQDFRFTLTGDPHSVPCLRTSTLSLTSSGFKQEFLISTQLLNRQINIHLLVCFIIYFSYWLKFLWKKGFYLAHYRKPSFHKGIQHIVITQ